MVSPPLTTLSPPIHLGKQPERLSEPPAHHGTAQGRPSCPSRHGPHKPQQGVRDTRERARRAHHGEHHRTRRSNNAGPHATEQAAPGTGEADGNRGSESLRLSLPTPDNGRSHTSPRHDNPGARNLNPTPAYRKRIRHTSPRIQKPHHSSPHQHHPAHPHRHEQPHTNSEQSDGD